MDAAAFVEARPDLPDGGRWTELIAGEPVSFAPPEPLHGTFVLNLSKAFAFAVEQGARAGRFGAGAAFETGLQTVADPDTVRFPAASLFAREVFDQLDRTIARVTPAAVVEVPGTPDRRRTMSRRIEEYHGLGVAEVWIADLAERSVTVAPADAAPQTLTGDARLTADALPGFAPTVEELFRLPEWWD
ncbi:MAG: Uma2 family endonuclease [Planctomycetota bacterium]